MNEELSDKLRELAEKSGEKIEILSIDLENERIRKISEQVEYLLRMIEKAHQKTANSTLRFYHPIFAEHYKP
jgi:hypothetical protein